MDIPPWRIKMSISFIALNRMMEKRATEDEEFQRLVKLNGKCTLADGRALSDEMLLEKLHVIWGESAVNSARISVNPSVMAPLKRSNGPSPGSDTASRIAGRAAIGLCSRCIC
jgi:hypothetical protein